MVKEKFLQFYNRIKKADFFIVANFLLIFCFIFSTLININSVDLYHVPKFVLLIGFLIVCSLVKFNKLSFKIVSYAYILVATIIVFMMLVFRVDFYYKGAGRLTVQFSGYDKIDPNYLAGLLLTPLILCIYLIFKENKLYLQIIMGILFCLIFVCIVLTGSRGSLLASVLAILVYFLKSIKYNLKNTLILLSIVVFGVVFALFLAPYVLPQRIARRIDVRNWMDGSNKLRISHWYNTLLAIKEKIVFGYGLNSSSKIVSKVLGIDAGVSHNTFLEIWIQAGIFPLIIVLVIGAKIVLTKKSKFSSCLVVAYFIAGFFLTLHPYFSFWCGLAFAIIIFKDEIKDEENSIFYVRRKNEND